METMRQVSRTARRASDHAASMWVLWIAVHSTAASVPAMREAGIAGISPGRAGKGFTCRDPDADLAPYLVQRDFTADGPNRLWVTDLTVIPLPRAVAATVDVYGKARVGDGDPAEFVRDAGLGRPRSPSCRPRPGPYAAVG